MHLSVSRPLVVFTWLWVCTAGCATATPSPTAQPTISPTINSSSQASETLPAPSATVVPLPPLEEWKTYSNSEFGFSISYPAHLEITLREDIPVLYIGEQFHIGISDINPLDCRGDCPVVESTKPAVIDGLEATKIAGYIGSIGGNIPQQYLRYIVQKDDRFYIFTFYALSFKATNYETTTIWPFHPGDIAFFEQILATFKFTE